MAAPKHDIESRNTHLTDASEIASLLAAYTAALAVIIYIINHNIGNLYNYGISNLSPYMLQKNTTHIPYIQVLIATLMWGILNIFLTIFSMRNSNIKTIDAVKKLSFIEKCALSILITITLAVLILLFETIEKYKIISEILAISSFCSSFFLMPRAIKMTIMANAIFFIFGIAAIITVISAYIIKDFQNKGSSIIHTTIEGCEKIIASPEKEAFYTNNGIYIKSENIEKKTVTLFIPSWKINYVEEVLNPIKDEMYCSPPDMSTITTK